MLLRFIYELRVTSAVLSLPATLAVLESRDSRNPFSQAPIVEGPYSLFAPIVMSLALLYLELPYLLSLLTSNLTTENVLKFKSQHKHYLAKSKNASIQHRFGP